MLLGERQVQAAQAAIDSVEVSDPVSRALLRNEVPFLSSYALAALVLEADSQVRQDQTSTPMGSPEAFPPAVRQSPAPQALTAGPPQRPPAAATPDRSGSARDLLAICLQPNATRAFVPVAKALQQRACEVHLLLDGKDSSSQRAAREAALPFSLVRDRDAALRAHRIGHVLWETRKLAWCPPAIERFLTEANVAADPRQVNRLQRRLQRELLRGAWRAVALRAALEAAPASNVLYITHRALLDELLGTTHPGAQRLFYLQGIVPEIPPIRTKLDVQVAVCGSNFDVPYLRRCGIPDDLIHCVGYPDYDGFVKIEKATARAHCEQQWPEAKGRKLVVFTSQYRTALFSDAAREQNLGAVLEAARLSPEIFWVIKLHPRREQWAPVDPPPNLAVVKEFETPALIKAADACVTYWSTTALETVLLETPLVQLNATRLPDYFNLVSRWGGDFARSRQELTRQVASAVTTPPEVLHQRRADLGVVGDGRAAERAADALAAHLR